MQKAGLKSCLGVIYESLLFGWGVDVFYCFDVDGTSIFDFDAEIFNKKHNNENLQLQLSHSSWSQSVMKDDRRGTKSNIL